LANSAQGRAHRGWLCCILNRVFNGFIAMAFGFRRPKHAFGKVMRPLIRFGLEAL
jgi:hypothetical protein